MKRDLNLILRILRHVETDGQPGKVLQPPDFQGIDQATVRYHVRLCSDAGFLKLRQTQMGELDDIRELTWAGHEYLDASRD